jgi:hypothetical protein
MFARAQRIGSLEVIVAIWALVAGAGLLGLAAYDFRPDDGGSPLANWPKSSRIVRDLTRANLIVWLHPRCPCSGATLDELSERVARARGKIRLHVVFIKPRSVPEGWERGELWRRAEAIPDARLIVDDAGVEASRFGAVTSGHVSLYGVDGRVRFSGGITRSRGCRGENPGLAAVTAALAGDAPGSGRSCVFGCPLFKPARRRAGGGS